MGENDTESEATFDEIAAGLRDRREEILQLFMSYDRDTFDSSEVRELGDIPDGSLKYHLDKLEGWGLIEELDERVPPTYGGGSDAKQWRLTERGEAFTEEKIIYVAPADVEELARRVVDLERDLDAMQESREDKIQDLRDEFHTRLDRLENVLTGKQPDGH